MFEVNLPYTDPLVRNVDPEVRPVDPRPLLFVTFCPRACMTREVTLRVMLSCPLGAWDGRPSCTGRFHAVFYDPESASQEKKGLEVSAWIDAYPQGRVVFFFGGQASLWRTPETPRGAPFDMLKSRLELNHLNELFSRPCAAVLLFDDDSDIISTVVGDLHTNLGHPDERAFEWIFGITGRVNAEHHAVPVAEFLEQVCFNSSCRDIVTPLCRAYQANVGALNASDLILVWRAQNGEPIVTKIVSGPNTGVPDELTARLCQCGLHPVNRTCGRMGSFSMWSNSIPFGQRALYVLSVTGHE